MILKLILTVQNAQYAAYYMPRMMQFKSVQFESMHIK